jgi:hypothetical protein
MVWQPDEFTAESASLTLVERNENKRGGHCRLWRHNGAMKNPKPSNVADLDRINLRLSGETFEAIDEARNSRPGRVSRNTWIAEAIEEKLARESSVESRRYRSANHA